MIEASLHRQLSRLLGPKLGADQKIELDRSLAEHYGLTSMKMVLLVTALCEDTGVGLERFTEQDLAAMRTPRQVIDIFEQHRLEGSN